ncbi:lysophospholipid acyltransferase [Nowakowskiella sp. JEL0407]|nr:lysophospholipid acyltransferase [Nowakowskiella sp. JEL0407]
MRILESHLEHQWIDQSSPDNTGPFMMLIIKLGFYIWSIHDGTTESIDQLPGEIKQSVIQSPPPLLNFLGFCFFFNGWVVGPAFEYVEYEQFINLMPPFNYTRGRYFAAAKLFVVGLISIIAYLILDPIFSHARMLQPEFLQEPFWFRYFTLFKTIRIAHLGQKYRLLYFQLIGVTQRTKFYGAWKASESSLTLSGLNTAESPIDKKIVHNRLENVSISGIELASCPRDFVASWNKITAKWLRRCVYYRLITPPPTQKRAGADKRESSKRGFSPNVANFATFLISSIWHGTKASYYMVFFCCAILTIIGKQMRSAFHKYRGTIIPAPLYDAAGVFLTLVSFNYTFTPFGLLNWKDVIQIWSTVGFVGHYVMFAMIVAFTFGGSKSNKVRKAGTEVPIRVEKND